MTSKRSRPDLLFAGLAMALFVWTGGCGPADSGNFTTYRETQLPDEGGPAAENGGVGNGEGLEVPLTSQGNREHDGQNGNGKGDGNWKGNGNGKGTGPTGSAEKSPPPTPDSSRQGNPPALAGDDTTDSVALAPDAAGLGPRAGAGVPFGPALMGDPARDDARPHVPREIELLVPDKQFRVEGPQGAIRVSYDDIDLLKVLNMEPVPPDATEHFPQWLKDLDGRRVRIRGFMYPAFETELERFGLARDNGICCFVRKAKIYDLFEVQMRDGETAQYVEGRPIEVVGVFQIRPWVEDGELLRLYRMVDALVVR